MTIVGCCVINTTLQTTAHNKSTTSVLKSNHNNSDVSTESVVTCDVPQGSVLGPILFLLYTADVTNIALRCGLDVHSYADDTHLYVHCNAVNCAADTAKLAACTDELDDWLGIILL